MILDFDIGNTRIKWILSLNDNIIQRGALNESELEGLFITLNQHYPAIARIRVASVRPSCHNTLEHYSSRYCQLQPEYAVVQKQFGKIKNAYNDVSQMGVDRWLGIIAASRMCEGACVVVSAGSAITVDLLDANEHLGGFIGPGLRLMRQALYRDTDQVKLESIDHQAILEPGISTQQAVSNGLLLMQLGLIDKAMTLLAAGQPTILITGGDGPQLEQSILRSGKSKAADIMYEPDLVFKGISIAL